MKSKNQIRTSFSRKVFLVFNTLFFLFMMFACLYPLWYVFIQSISDGRLAHKAMLLPVGTTINNYRNVFTQPEIIQAFGMSVLRTVTGCVLGVFCSMLVGYLFTKETLPFRKLIYRMMVITMYVGGGLIPTFLVYKTYGFMNSFWVYIVPGMVGSYNVILIKTYIEQLPASLEESARIDGAGTFRVFLSIILPLSLPIAATIAIYITNGQWNSWFDNMLYNSTSKKLTTLQYLLYNYINKTEQLIAELQDNRGGMGVNVERLTAQGVKMTVTMVSVIPIMCVYPFMQRYLIKGIMIGAVKG